MRNYDQLVAFLLKHFRFNQVKRWLKIVNSANVPPMTRDEVLSAWESKWGKLDEKWKPQFLADLTLSQIIECHPDLVREAIRREKKLDRIILELGSLKRAFETKPVRVVNHFAEDPVSVESDEEVEDIDEEVEDIMGWWNIASRAYENED